jgi:hypothetical protein
LSKVIHECHGGKKLPKSLGYFGTFRKIAQRKQSPNRRKFAQSGHPELTNGSTLNVPLLSRPIASPSTRLFLKLPTYTLAGFKLTTHDTADGGDTTQSHNQRQVFLKLA